VSSNLVNDLGQRRRVVHTGYGYPRAFAGKREGYGATDPATATSDHGYFVEETHLWTSLIKESQTESIHASESHEHCGILPCARRY
jgi:hypothetical protein